MANEKNGQALVQKLIDGSRNIDMMQCELANIVGIIKSNIKFADVLKVTGSRFKNIELNEGICTWVIYMGDGWVDISCIVKSETKGDCVYFSPNEKPKLWAVQAIHASLPFFVTKVTELFPNIVSKALQPLLDAGTPRQSETAQPSLGDKKVELLLELFSMLNHYHCDGAIRLDNSSYHILELAKLVSRVESENDLLKIHMDNTVYFEYEED